MFGVSIPELLIVLVVVLLALGPDRLPGAARKLGEFMAMFRKSSDSVRREVYNALYAPAEEMTKELRDSARDLKAIKEDLYQELSSRDPSVMTCEDQEKLAELEAERVSDGTESPQPTQQGPSKDE